MARLFQQPIWHTFKSQKKDLSLNKNYCLQSLPFNCLSTTAVNWPACEITAVQILPSCASASCRRDPAPWETTAQQAWRKSSSRQPHVKSAGSQLPQDSIPGAHKERGKNCPSFRRRDRIHLLGKGSWRAQRALNPGYCVACLTSGQCQHKTDICTQTLLYLEEVMGAGEVWNLLTQRSQKYIS